MLGVLSLYDEYRCHVVANQSGVDVLFEFLDFFMFGLVTFLLLWVVVTNKLKALEDVEREQVPDSNIL